MMRTASLALLLQLCALVCSSQVATPTHIIGVRTVNGVGQFYRRDTGAVFIPRGNVFVKLAQQTQLPGYGGTVGTVITHSLFNVGLYDASDAENALALMESSGYNTVRVHFNDCCTGGIGNTVGKGLSQVYLANVADFLSRAKSHGIFVVLATAFFPDAGGYSALVPPNPNFVFPNVLYLTAGGIDAVSKYHTDIIAGLAALNAPFDAILGFEIEQELCFDLGAAPLSTTSGIVTTANGKSYDMSDSTSRQAMMDDNLINFIDQVRSAIIQVDPTALIDVSFFPPNTPNPTPFEDPVHQFIHTYPAICCSTADFIDLHTYLNGLTLGQLVQNFGFAGLTAKPIVMFEYGITLNSAVSAEAAAAMLQQWQTESVSYGYSGWVLWTWDLNDAFWSALSGNGVVNRALAPAYRPDPSHAGSYLDQDLAFEATATASKSAPDGWEPARAVDGLLNTAWNAGGPPPQWIEIDLHSPSIVTAIRLTVFQGPSGPTVHDLYVGQGGGQPQMVTEFSGTTQDQQVLTWTPSQPLVGVTSIRVTTVSFPGWPGWREIEIISGDSGQLTISSVVNGASFDAAITPGSWVTIQGTGLAASARGWQASDFNGTQLPTTLDGVHVTIDGAPASVSYISPTQLNVQAPSTIHTGQAVALTVTRDNVQIPGSAHAQSKTYDPALFGYAAAGSLYAAAVFPDGTVVGDPAKTAGTRGASPGDAISLYGTGFGASPSGVVINSATALSNPVVVTVGGQPATVQYAGLVGVGLFQINIVVPNLPAGDYPVAVQFQGAMATTSPSIPIR